MVPGCTKYALGLVTANIFLYVYSVFQKFPHMPQIFQHKLAPLEGRSVDGPQ